MIIDPDQSSENYVALAQSALASVASDMSASVVEACRADAVLFCFNDAAGGTKVFSADIDGLQTNLVDDLTAFWDRKKRNFAAYDSSGIHHHVDDIGQQFIFLLLPLEADGLRVGALAVAISRSNWIEQPAFSACNQIARLVAMNVNAAQARSKLEVDLAEMNLRAHRLRRQAETDPLTGVENKTSFDSKARERLNAFHRPAALLAVDLDFFKQVNDIYGHQFGDIYLQTIARTLKTSVPDAALVGRTGGDEFCILLDLPRASSNYLEGLLSRVRNDVQRNVALLGKPDLGRVSIGVSLFPTQAAEYERLFAMADTALYACKATERNSTTIYDVAEHGGVFDGDSPNLKVADFETISPAFQPILHLESGACVGLEVLSRQRGYEGEMAVSKSIGWMLGDHHIAPKLTRHIIHRALDDLCSLCNLNELDAPDLWLNVTKFDLLDPEFVFDLQGMLDTHCVSWCSIVIEVNEETMLGERSGQIYHSLQEMRHRGARVALDDFGTGYAGLMHVREWPVDIIKIDRSFVRNIATDRHASVVVEALLMIANSMNQIVVVEGLETEEQLTCARALKCDYGQGYLFDRALTREELSTYLVCPEAEAMSA
ncbi:MAG: EAL domain-containing protein [Aliishimia sp.]